MRRVRFPSLNFQDKSLQVVVSDLNTLSKDVDPKGEGVTLVLLDAASVTHRVTFTAQNISFEAALTMILKGSGLRFQVESRFVVIDAATDQPVVPSRRESTKGGEIISLDQRRAIFVIKIRDTVSTVTQTGQATGFLADIRGKRMLVTNLHVIRGVARTEDIVAENIEGRSLKLGRVWGAVGHDVAILEVIDPEMSEFAFEFADSASQLHSGEGIVIVGNPQGGGTILESQGTISGVGPRGVEYSAATFPGNSGSPVISLATQKVVAVHTSAVPVSLKTIGAIQAAQRKDSPVQEGVRRFGTRFDTIKQWEAITWRDWVGQDRQIYEFWKRLYAFDSLAAATGTMATNGFNSQVVMLAPDLWSAFQDYDLAWARNDNKQEREMATKRIIQTVNSIYGPDAAFGAELRRARASFYSYYWDELDDIGNNLASLSQSWKQRQTSILHSWRLLRESR
jgi:S1-C subfamily serine protease